MRVRFLLPLALACSAAAIAVPPHKIPAPPIPFDPPEYVCYRTAGAIEIDGRLDEASWEKAEWTRGFMDIEGRRRPEPRFRTVVQMLWDDDHLYIGAFLEEPDVWATLTSRDSVIYQDNDFEVFIDPDGDTHAYYELEINALNTVWDLLLVKPYRDGGPAIHAWDIQGLRTAVHVNGTLNDPGDRDKSWTVEMALPFAVLKEAIPGKPQRPGAGDQWRLNFSRVEWRHDVAGGGYVKAADAASKQPLPEDNWTWAPQGLINIHYPEMWGFLQFSGRTVGRGRDRFASRPEDKVKWALRKIYYAEWAHYDEAGAFSTDLAALGLKDDRDLRVRGWTLPEIEATDSLFEAAVGAKDGVSWRIRQDGLVWTTGAPAE